MFGRPTGSLAITLAVGIVAAASALSMAALLARPGNPVRAVAEALLAPAADAPRAVFAAEEDVEPDVTGSIVLPLRRGQ